MSSRKKQILELLIDTITIFVLVFLIRSYVVSPFRVSGPSMCDTLNQIDGKCVENGTDVGEFMIIEKLSYLFKEPERGDIVVFKPDNVGVHYIKRIIAIGGDKLQIKDDGFVYVTPKGGKETLLDETYLNEENYGKTMYAHTALRIFEIPEGSYFVMGDNRSHSSDSRHCFKGCDDVKNPDSFIKRENIKGKALITLWPFANYKIIHHIDYGF